MSSYGWYVVLVLLVAGERVAELVVSLRNAKWSFAQGGVDINRIDDAVQTVVAEFARIAAEPIEADELEKARNFAKGRLVLSLEDPKGMIMFGLRNEVLEGNLREPDEVLAGLDAVTIEDVQRVAQDIVRENRLNFALIGPFDDPERFQKLLALSA